jgi:WD40 repeat protein
VHLVRLQGGEAMRIAMPAGESGRTPHVTAACTLDESRVALALLHPGRSTSALVVLDVRTGEIVPTAITLPTVIGALKKLSDGRVLCGRNDGMLTLWDPVLGGTTEHQFSRKGRARVRCIAEAKELGVVLVAGSFGSKYPIQIWDREPFSLRPIGNWIAGHSDQITAMQVLPDGRTLVSGGQDCMLRFWHIEGRIALGAIKAFPDWIRSIAVSPDGSLVATGGSEDRLLRVWGSQPHHYSRVPWEGAAHYSWPAIQYLTNLLPTLRPEGIPTEALHQAGLGKPRNEIEGETAFDVGQEEDGDFD